jgi:heme-degrading monooxygenase HmoA
MIVRIVKMEFREEGIPEFLDIFAGSRQKILSFEGCSHVQLLQDVSDPSVFFTYSYWDTEEHLNTYRNSDLFDGVWKRTKALFRAKPMAWSTTDQTKVDVHTV